MQFCQQLEKLHGYLENLGHAVMGSVVADVASFIAAVVLAQWFFE